MGNIGFTLFTLSAVEVLCLDVILKVGDREDHSNAKPTSVQALEMQTTKNALLVPKFTCQGHLVTTLDIHDLRSVSILEGGATGALSHLPDTALLECGQEFRFLDLDRVLLVLELLGQLLRQCQVSYMGKVSTKTARETKRHTRTVTHHPSGSGKPARGRSRSPRGELGTQTGNMNGASKSPGRDCPRRGSTKRTEDTEGRHFRDRTRMKGERMRWRIGLDPVVMAARDFVWLRPAIQTYGFSCRDTEVRLVDSSHQGSPPTLALYEIPRILQGTSYTADRKTCNPERNQPPRKCNPSYDLQGLGAGYVPASVGNGCDSHSDDDHVRWSNKELDHLLGCARINYREVGCVSLSTPAADQVLLASSSVHLHAHNLSSWILPVAQRPLITCYNGCVRMQGKVL